MMMDELFIADMDELYRAVQDLAVACPYVDQSVLDRVREMVDEFAERYQLSADALFSNLMPVLGLEEE